jgi:nucleoside-diphosphate-sugar epimerase
VELVFRALGRRPPVSRQTLEKYLEDVAVSGDTIRKELGFSPEWDLDRGWRETIEGMRRLGRL